MSNKKKVTVILVGLVLLVLPVISAFANTFLEDKTMQLYKGETGEYCIYLQNTGEEDLVQVIKIFEGEEYIRNIDEINKEFNVLIRTVSDDLPVCMILKLPGDAEKGIKYKISYGVSNIESNEEKSVVSFAPVLIRENFYLTERLDKRPVSVVVYFVLVFVGLALLGMIIGYRYSRRRIKAIKELERLESESI